MDINFHYFAVKTLALKAGFAKNEAQLIAEFSQYVDDYEGKTLELTQVLSSIHMMESITDDHQKNTISPFHFIPSEVNKKPDEYKKMLTKPAVLGDGSVISQLLSGTIDLLGEKNTDNRRLYLLVRLGAYLHIFADTYAHQGFNGYKSEKNTTEILDVRHAKLAGENITAKHDSAWGIKYSMFPSIGHANAGHLPDLTYVKYKLREYNDYRDNCALMMDAAKGIYGILLACKPSGAQAKWDNFSNTLKSVFEQEYGETNMEVMSRNWETGFAGIAYKYDKGAIEERLNDKSHASGSAASEEHVNEAVALNEALNNVKQVLYEGIPAM